MSAIVPEETIQGGNNFLSETEKDELFAFGAPQSQNENPQNFPPQSSTPQNSNKDVKSNI